jgi:CheY-like chemotaxis protein
MNMLKTVLLIDDDQIHNFVCENIITSEGFAEEVISFEWAEEALKFLQERAESSPQNFPEIIFLDINMPGMDGWLFLEEYKKLPENLISKSCLFMLSSAVDRKDIINAKNHIEVKDFFSKPLSTETLDLINEEYLEKLI